MNVMIRSATVSSMMMVFVQVRCNVERQWKAKLGVRFNQHVLFGIVAVSTQMKEEDRGERQEVRALQNGL